MNAREQLLNAMFVLLNKYPIEKITNEMIFKQSNVARGSFYRYFQDKYQLMTACYVYFTDKMIKEYGDGVWVLELEEIFQFMLENKKAFENLFKSEGPDSFTKFLFSHYLNKHKEDYMKIKNVTHLTINETYTLEACVSIIIHCEKEWVIRGMELSPKEMKDIILRCVPDDIKSVFKLPMD